MDNKTANLTQKQVHKYKEKFSSDFTLNREKYNKLISLCGLADMIMAEFDGENMVIMVDPVLINGIISIQIPELILEDGRTHAFFTMIKQADFLRFTQNAKDKLCIQFGVNNLWTTE